MKKWFPMAVPKPICDFVVLVIYLSRKYLSFIIGYEE